MQDAGCNQKLIDKFFSLLDQKQFDQIFILLRKYRNTLLDNIHKQQKEIDILDYLIMDLKKRTCKKGEHMKKKKIVIICIFIIIILLAIIVGWSIIYSNQNENFNETNTQNDTHVSNTDNIVVNEN